MSKDEGRGAVRVDCTESNSHIAVEDLNCSYILTSTSIALVLEHDRVSLDPWLKGSRQSEVIGL